MEEEKRNDIVIDISADSIACIESVATDAERALREHRRAGADALITVNTLNDIAQVNRLGEIGDSEKQSLHDLTREPVIARVEYVDEDGNEGAIFVTRGSPRPVEGFKNIASYRSALGRVASLPVGEDFILRIGGKQKSVTVQSSAKLHPRCEDGSWDSANTEMDIEGLGKRTIASLRALLEPHVGPVDDDILQALLDEDESPNIIEGIRRGFLSHVGLRDQPILDQHQDEIFRLPVNSCCFLSGPPGTGKTTTLIRRLGQKLDSAALEPSELDLVQRAGIDSGVSHGRSWIMFSPTELLRQYVKEAFAREGIPASDDHIRTWEEYRKEIARDYLGILRTGANSGPFIERAADAYLLPECGTSRATDWYDDFDAFLKDQLREELTADVEALTGSESSDLSALGKRLGDRLQRRSKKFDGGIAASLLEFGPTIRELLAQRKDESDRLLTLSLNRILHDDRGFLDAFRAEIARQASVLDYQPEDEEDADADSDVLDEDEPEFLPTRTVSRKQALAAYEKAVRTHARARLRRREVSRRSRSGRLLEWLGEKRLPGASDLDALARIISEQTRLRKFGSLDNLLTRSVPRLYKKFRKERLKEGLWYAGEPGKPTDIAWKELDLVVLAMLRMAGSVLSGYRNTPGAEAPDSGLIGNIRSLYKNQILVDEASDFSAVQLAAMYELSHPMLRSFFACGDFNQRLTTWGISGEAELDWVDSRIERYRITTSYRQSGKLVELARAVAALGGSPESEIVLPDRLDIEGVSAVWSMRLTTDEEIAGWLAQRIREIEAMVRGVINKVPSIAVLVNDEAKVERIAGALGKHLEEMSLSAVACKDGKVVGNDRDVRVFNIQHIKGMEFEAVFFVDLDEIIRDQPDLYTKYLYVGATRAATYLGATCRSEMPEEISPLAPLFEEAWAL